MPLLKKSRLLLLDDDPSMQRLMSTLLRREGHRVDVVSEASQAIQHLGRYKYDALLLDIMTPTEGGMTVIRHLRESNPELLRRVVLVTGSPDSLLKSVSHDVFGVVRKPFEPAELMATINRVIRK
jgi:DNA-binding response OmpR family regulator